VVKVKFTLEQATRPRGGVEVQLYFSFDLSPLLRWGVHASGTLPPPPPKNPVLIVQEAGWAGLNGRGKISPPQGFDPLSI